MRLSFTRLVTVPGSVLADCEAEARRCFPDETGGAFMGRRHPDGGYRVEHMIGPGAGAEHRPASFVPNAEWQWAEMRRLHGAFPGLAFLGDWHTHPRAWRGRLSGIDLAALSEILASEATRADSIMSVILSGGPGRWRWRAWEATIGTGAGRKSKPSIRGLAISRG